MLTLEPRIVNSPTYVILVSILRSTPNNTPLKYRCLVKYPKPVYLSTCMAYHDLELLCRWQAFLGNLSKLLKNYLRGTKPLQGLRTLLYMCIENLGDLGNVQLVGFNLPPSGLL